MGVVGVSEDGVVGSGVGSTAGAVGSSVGTVGSTVGVVGSVTGVVGSAAGGSDTGVRPMTCCCVLVDGSTGVSVANETVPNVETMPNSIVKRAKKLCYVFSNLKPPEITSRARRRKAAGSRRGNGRRISSNGEFAGSRASDMLQVIIAYFEQKATKPTPARPRPAVNFL